MNPFISKRVEYYDGLSLVRNYKEQIQRMELDLSKMRDLCNHTDDEGKDVITFYHKDAASQKNKYWCPICSTIVHKKPG